MRELYKFEIEREHRSNIVVILLRYHETYLEREHIKYNFMGNFCKKSEGSVGIWI